MAKIDLNRERGVRVTNKPSGGLDYNFGSVYAGINAQQKANDALANGMNHVGRVLTGIYDDMAATRNRQETLAGETAYFDIQEQTNQKILQQIEAGEFDGAGGQDKFKEACEKAQTVNNERFLKWCDKNASTDDVQDMLMLRSKNADARNFAHLGGVMAKHARHLRFTTAENGMNREAEGGNVENVMKWVESIRGAYSDELVDEMARKYTKAACLTQAKNEAADIGRTLCDKDREAKINLNIEYWRKQSDRETLDKGLEFLGVSGAKEMLGFWKDVDGKNEALMRKKTDGQLKTRIARLIESSESEFAARSGKLDEWISGNKYLDELGRFEAREEVKKTLLAAKQRDKKNIEAAKKEYVKAFTGRTQEMLGGVMSGATVEYSQEELANIAQIRGGVSEALSTPDFDENGKVSMTAKEKADALVLKFFDAVKSYNPKLDKEGVYARALFYNIEAAFADAPPDAAYLSEIMDLDSVSSVPEYITKYRPGPGGAILETAKNPDWKPSVSKEENAKRESELRKKYNMRESLIYDPETKGRLIRELGQSMGVYPDAKIKLDDVRAISRPLFEAAMGKAASKLSPYQATIYGELSRAFETRAMTEGFDNMEEYSKWVRTSPYVATMREKLKLLPDAKEKDTGWFFRDKNVGFDTGFAHTSNEIKKAPQISPSAGLNIFEDFYLKMKSNGAPAPENEE